MTPAEHKWRLAGIGGSDAPIVMLKDAHPWCTPADLLLIKTKQKDPEPPTYVMRRGLQMEPEARSEYEKLTGIPMPKDALILDGKPFIRGNFDGLNHDARHGLEIKCPGREDHLTALSGRIPDKYIWQCVHLALLSGYDKFDYFSYNPSFGPENGRVIVPFRRSNRLERELLQEETVFWKEVQRILDQRNRGMAQENKFYTAEEVIRILHEAKKAGVTSLILPGYEAAFGTNGEKTSVDRARPNESGQLFRIRKSRKSERQENIHRCKGCRSTNLEHWMKLCFSCFRESRE